MCIRDRDNIHVIAAAYRFLLFLDFHFVKVGDFPLDCLYGFGLVDTVDMQIDDNARFQVQNVRDVYKRQPTFKVFPYRQEKSRVALMPISKSARCV